MRMFKRMIVCVMTAVMTISCMPGVSALAGESETTMAEELAVEIIVLQERLHHIIMTMIALVILK